MTASQRRLSNIAVGVFGLVSGLFPLAPAFAQTPPASAPRDGAVMMRDVDIRTFIEDVSNATGRSFIIDPRVSGKVTVLTQQALNERELFDVLLSTLRVNGFVATPTASGAYRIVPDAVAAREPGGGGGDLDNRYITQVFSLKFADADAISAALKPMLSERGQVTSLRRGNAVVAVDFGSNVARMRDVIAKLDQDTSSVRTVRLRNTAATEMARVAQQLATGVGDDSGARSLIQAVAVNSSNAVVLRGDQQVLNRIAPMLEQLDSQADFRSGVQVIPLRYAVAEDLVPVLKDLSQSLTGAAGETGQGGGNRRANIAAHKSTNALIISADPETQEALSRVVRSLDVRRQQVLVQAIIVEVSDSVAKDLGLQFLLADPTGGSATPFLSTSFGASAPNLLAVTGAVVANRSRKDNPAIVDLQRAALSSLVGTRGLLGGVAGRRNDGTTLGLILNAFAQDRDSNVLSTPSVMTLDNQPAELLVGQQIPITTGEALSSDFQNQFRTIKREDVGVRLSVTPQISEGGAIRLAIKQEVSSIFGPIVADSTDLITNRRAINTAVQVDPGQIIVLGGLIQEEISREQTGVPGLRKVPVVGNAFRSTSKGKRRTNLMVFLRPTIVNDSAQVAEVTRQQVRALQDMGGLDKGIAGRLDKAVGAAQQK